ncbi:FAD-dependent oxidoreductase [Zhihengliuella sp.]|uniref:FAD-dependent oxidoreductase n=1 Tax=Zhihengliuella sp. TaxID=1954483 RepID=UPI002811BC94|nr:FAD-dependent oxidoreductase [Zhihengliuella sp.]
MSSRDARNPGQPTDSGDSFDGAGPDEHRRRILVVGGVAGGMSFAARARRLDRHVRITVLDRGDYVSFSNCGLPYYVDGEIEDSYHLAPRTPETFAQQDIDVRLRHDVVALDPDARTVTARVTDESGATREETFEYDDVVLSPGGDAIIPPIDGLQAGFDAGRVRTLRTVDDALALRGHVDAGARTAVVIGGGYIGVEAAEVLARAGLDVALVQRSEHVLPPLEPEMARPVTEELERLGIAVHTGAEATAYRHDREAPALVLEHGTAPGDGTELPADVVVVSAGIEPATGPFEAAGIVCQDGALITDPHGRTNVPGVWAVGDAVASDDAVTGERRVVALAGPANRAGRAVADAMLGVDARPIPSALGTAVVRAGELTAAMTGANRKTLSRASIPAHTVHLHPTPQAGYIPGVEPIHLVVHFGNDGRLLGAQAVGEVGADKRIDVLATALRAGLGADDLVDLDLAYAPHYGSAKDPVNLAGMLGQDVIDGSLRLWYAEDTESVLAEALMVDVRGSEEFAEDRLRGSVNIPIEELLDRLDELRDRADGGPVRLLCSTGVKSAAAHRILAEAGFDSASLSGGLVTLYAALGPEARCLLA